MERVLCAAAAGLLAVAAITVGASAGPVAPGEVKIDDGKITKSLTGQPGSAVKGREWFANRKLGNCLACHNNSDMAKEEQFHGEVAPSLDGVADRWDEAHLRAIVVNAKKALKPDTLMPAFYRDSGFTRPLKGFEGKAILTADQVEDIVAYLKTLK
ncbi:MAG: sulfur oxidation c-type cytochrome SoxX [Alphaproteobacteria bacterium]|nr:sulfur oxidation c-type cytochrome SoxX [Alphaproteobacteria bacterium]